MIRKWSYIKKSVLTGKSAIYNIKPKNKTNILIKFKLKTFRTNTRFKDPNIKHTSFSRKRTILWKRRTNWKNYVIISANWVKASLSYRHFLNFVQNKELCGLSTPFSYINVFPKLLTNLRGITYSKLNYIILKKYFMKKKTLKNTLLISVKLNSLLQFYTTHNHYRLGSYNRTSPVVTPFIMYNKLFYTPKTLTKHSKYLFNTRNYQLILVIKTLLNLRSIFKCKTLQLINVKI